MIYIPILFCQQKKYQIISKKNANLPIYLPIWWMDVFSNKKSPAITCPTRPTQAPSKGRRSNLRCHLRCGHDMNFVSTQAKCSSQISLIFLFKQQVYERFGSKLALGFGCSGFNTPHVKRILDRFSLKFFAGQSLDTGIPSNLSKGCCSTG